MLAFQVAEANGKAVGLMGISDDVEVGSLAANFNLLPFGGLVKTANVPKQGATPPAPAAPSESKDQESDAKAEPEASGSKSGDEPLAPPGEDKGDEGEAKGTEGEAEAKDDEAEVKDESKAKGDESMAKGDEFEAKGDGVEAKVGDSGAAEAKVDEAKAEVVEEVEAEAKDGAAAPEAPETEPRSRAVTAEVQEEEEEEEANPHAGEPNAFSVTLFCIDGKFESRAADFLPHAFRAFPDREYCILTVPSTLLSEPALVRGFSAAAPLPGTSFSHSLFVVHRDALLAAAHLCVTRWRPSVAAELEAAGSLSRGLCGSVDRLVRSLGGARAAGLGAVLQEAGEDDDTVLRDGPGRCCFVVTLGPSVAVGLLVLDRACMSADRLNFLKTNFDLETGLALERIRSKNQAVLKCLLLDPVFHASARFVLKEAMRLFDKSLLLHEAAPNGPNVFMQHAPRLVLQHMVPAKVRTMNTLLLAHY